MSSEAEVAELAVTYAALILHDDKVAITVSTFVYENKKTMKKN